MRRQLVAEIVSRKQRLRGLSQAKAKAEATYEDIQSRLASMVSQSRRVADPGLFRRYEAAIAATNLAKACAAEDLLDIERRRAQVEARLNALESQLSSLDALNAGWLKRVCNRPVMGWRIAVGLVLLWWFLHL